MTILTIVLISSFATIVIDSLHQKVSVLAQTPTSPLNFSSPTTTTTTSSITVNKTTPVMPEGNSTFTGVNISATSSSSNSSSAQDVSTIILIPNPQSSSLNPTQNSSNISKSDSTPTDKINENENDSTSTHTAEEGKKEELNLNEANISLTTNATQRGEYKVDDNGVHYYDINNCSLVKGSSGIGDLSECEDAERVIKKELRG